VESRRFTLEEVLAFEAHVRDDNRLDGQEGVS
jgi:hypothetical protein